MQDARLTLLWSYHNQYNSEALCSHTSASMFLTLPINMLPPSGENCLQGNEANIYNVAEMRDEKNSGSLTRVNRVRVHVCLIIMGENIYNF